MYHLSCPKGHFGVANNKAEKLLQILGTKKQNKIIFKVFLNGGIAFSPK